MQATGDQVDVMAIQPADHMQQDPSKSPTGNNPIVSEQVLKSKFYDMTYEERGKALVISNTKFDNPCKNWKGQDTDATSMYQRFQDLGFDTELVHDSTKDEILEKFDQVAEEDHSRYDCFACTILTFGDKDGLWARDKVFTMKDIMGKLNASKCKTLALKPEIFFLQTSEHQEQHDMNVMDADADPSQYRPHPFKTMKIPNDADFLFVFSSMPGDFSSSSNEKGSVFINTLSEELNEMNLEEPEDFYGVLTRVCNRVARRDFKQSKQKQMPSFVSTLTKRIKFAEKD